jgi:hypothetical protein
MAGNPAGIRNSFFQNTNLQLYYYTNSFGDENKTEGERKRRRVKIRIGEGKVKEKVKLSL